MLKPQRVLETLSDADRGPRRRDLDDRRRPAPDVGDAVPALRPAAHVHHLGRARDDGLRHPGGDRREGGAARRDRRLRRRRRLLPDDLPGAGDGDARGAADRRRASSTTATSGWCSSGRTCSSTSGCSQVAPDAPGAGLRRARRGLRRRRLHRRRPRTSSSRRWPRRSRCGRTAVVDCRVDPGEQCFPMIPAGAAALDLVEFRGARRWRVVKHTISVLLENKPGALAADRDDVRPPRLQHRVARRRADRAARRLAHHAARRLRARTRSSRSRSRCTSSSTSCAWPSSSPARRSSASWR